MEVDLYGLPTDTVRKRYKTKIVNSNGMNPVYDSEDFSFKRVGFTAPINICPDGPVSVCLLNW